jgi:hypothetical protein
MGAIALGIWGGFVGFTIMGLFEWNFGDVEVTIALCFLAGTALAATRLAEPQVLRAMRSEAPEIPEAMSP